MPTGNTRRPCAGLGPGTGPCGPRPAQGPLASDAACWHTQAVRSHSHGPNVMIIGWPGVPVLRASQACPSQWCVTGFRRRVASWWHAGHGVAKRSGPGFKSSRWLMFSQLKRLGTSSSHAGGSSSEAAAAAAVTDRHRDSLSQVRDQPIRQADIAIPVSIPH
jgi:hypothetical protein